MTIDDWMYVHPILPIQPITARPRQDQQSPPKEEEPPPSFEVILQNELEKNDH